MIVKIVIVQSTVLTYYKPDLSAQLKQHQVAL